MNFSRFSQRKWNYYALSFAFPFFSMVFVMLFSQYTPFGRYSMLYSDMYHQYFPFFVSFRRALLSGDSLLYIWDMGMGMDHLGLISYYLASPLNLLSVLVPEPVLLQFFSFLVPVKLGLAGLFFSIFLKNIFHKYDLSIVLFSAFYGLCAWGLGYQWNVMWLDTFALLPLVVLGMVRLIREKKFILYTLTLFLSIAANYYIGFFTCIFLFLLFFIYEICRWRGWKSFFLDLLRIAFFSLLAIAMTAFLELPALAALQTTNSSVNKFPKGFRLNIADDNTWRGLLDAMRQVAGNMNGGLEPTFKEGLPNLYCGVICNFLAFLFLTAKKVRIRDKIASVLLLLFFNISFIIRQLDYIWHGFHFTNMIPYRFSFLYSFVIIYMAYRAYLMRKYFHLWQIILAFILNIGLIFCCKDWKNEVLWAYNGIFLLIYAGVFFSSTLRKSMLKGDLEQRRQYWKNYRIRKQVGAIVMSSVIVLELIMNIVNFAVWFPGTSISNYPMGKQDTRDAIAFMKQRESGNLFYRAETAHTQTLNDGALNGYHGVSTFTSSANVKVTEFMKALGYGAKNTYNRYCFEESSPVSSLFLSLKYMIERYGKVQDNPYFEDVFHQGNVHLLENKAYLPLGFLTDPQLVNLDFSNNSNPFGFQNQLFTAATGAEENVWQFIPAKALNIHAEDVKLNTTNSSGFSSYTTEDKAGTVIYTYTSVQEGLMCVHLDLSKRNSFTFYKNGKELYSETYSIPQMLSVCQVHPGDIIDIKLSCKKDQTGNITIRSAVLDEACFKKGFMRLSESVMNLRSFRNTKIEGTISCKQKGLLYVSVPQDGNWSAAVDGEPSEIILIGGAMIGLLVSEGTHEITLSYTNKAFKLGGIVTASACLLFVIIALIHWRIHRYRGKYLNYRNMRKKQK